MKRIVIIDDDKDILESLKLLLEASGYNIIGYPNAHIFLQDLSTPPPDLYLIDKQMPGMDGLALCQLLKEQAATRDIPVVIISASPNIRSLAKDSGASDIVEKPFSIKTLREVVRRALEP